MKKQNLLRVLFVWVSVFLIGLPFIYSQAQKKETFKVEKVSGDVYGIFGSGGNIGILRCEDQLLLVDTKYSRTANDILKAINDFSSLPVKIVINTHYHGDHTGGNSIIGKGATIISQKNCKDSLLRNLQPEETPESIGAPQKTYEKEKNLAFGKETVKLVHYGPAHTCGDTIVIFEKSRVVHTGDLFFNGLPPYIDVKDGADTKNWINIIRTLVKKYPDFKVIPGHGPQTDMKTFAGFADYLEYLRKKVMAAFKAGKSREQAMESIDLSAFSHIKDRGKFLTKKQNIGWIYDELKKKITQQ